MRRWRWLVLAAALSWVVGCDSSGSPEDSDAVPGDASVDGTADAPKEAAGLSCVLHCGSDAGPSCEVALLREDGTPCGTGPCGQELECQAGECVPRAPVCDDGDPCTEDSCQEEGTCANHAFTGGELRCGEGECSTVAVQCLAGELQTCTPKAPADEACDGKDNDCDGMVDDGIPEQVCGQGACAVTVAGCQDGQAPVCVPNDAAAAKESCNGQDDDCNGTVDDPGASGCQPYLKDADQDGYSASDTDYQCLCTPAVPYTALVGGDCDEQDPAISPVAVEKCNGFDDNCDGQTDGPDTPDCTRFYGDADLDGYGDEAVSACLCVPDEAHPALAGDDCDDADDTVNPAASEACNGHDDDCDDAIDEQDAAGCTKYFVDDDGDGYGVTSETEFQCLCQGQVPAAPYKASKGGDCCDKDTRVHPYQWDYSSSISACSTWDFNCDGVVTNYYPDYGYCEMELVTCKVNQYGWTGSKPDCGASGPYLTDCSYDWGVCDKTTETRTQSCL
jgi:hypothetical protein